MFIIALKKLRKLLDKYVLECNFPYNKKAPNYLN
jgi:hypothetical protein